MPPQAPSAASSDPAPGEAASGREKLLSLMVALCDARGGELSGEARGMLETIFLDLVGRAERDVRLRLAHRLAGAIWAPTGLINALALDDIEIARPIIARSPVLKDVDLLMVLAVATLEHQIEVARRPHLSPVVVETLLAEGRPAVLQALVANRDVDLSEGALERLVEAARQVVELREPLARHPGLSRALAQALYAWLGSALRSDLARRFRFDAGAFDADLEATLAESLDGAPPPPPGDPEREPEAERCAMERRLVAKLQAADELRTGFLLRALRQRRLHLFQVALATLASLRTEDVRSACDADDPELLALACAAVGLDRSVFPTVLSSVRTLNEGRPAGCGGRETVAHAFHLRGEAACETFRSRLSASSLTAPPQRSHFPAAERSSPS